MPMISEVKNYKLIDVKSSSEKREKLYKVYKELFGENLVFGCDGCIEDAIFRINYHLKKQKEMNEKPKCDYTLKKGVVVYIPALAMHITNDNITNELAEKVLKINAKNIGYFEKFPAKSIVETKEDDKKVEEPAKEHVEELPEEPVVEKETIEVKHNYTFDWLMMRSKKELLEIIDGFGDGIAFKYTMANTKIDMANAIIKQTSK